jgi:ankyrin repeat protein
LIANKRSSTVFGLIFAILFYAMLIAFAWFSPLLSREARPYHNESFPSFVQSAPAHVIREIFEGDVYPNQRDTFGTPPIFMVGEADKLQALLECSTDPNLRDADRETKLSKVARYGDIKNLRVLLEAGVEIETKIPDFGRDWIAMVSAYKTGHSEIVNILAGFD